jgi:HD-GYP domain-containing protein (c-di-GMP phosphodiesterase class II)
MGMLLAIAYAALGAVGVLVFSVPVIMMRFSQKQYVERTEENMRELKRMNQELTAANQEIRQANVAIRELNEELFLTLARIIDARDPYVGGHANKVADYAAAIAAELGMETERIEPLRQAGFLHDIGKIGVSEQVLHKPAKLTREEYEYVKTHAPLGGELLMMCRGLRHLAPFVRHHHERWDGTGYPDRLAGEKIPLEARILAVCDAAEAMASDRPYRKGMSPDEVIDEVRRCAGTQFDPRVARAFVSVAERERDNLLVNSAYEVDQRQYSYKELLRTYRSRSNTTAKRASVEATAATSSALH